MQNNMAPKLKQKSGKVLQISAAFESNENFLYIFSKEKYSNIIQLASKFLQNSGDFL